jgi:hypothetical protein
MLVDHVPSPVQGNKHSVEQNYTGDLMGEIGLGDHSLFFFLREILDCLVIDHFRLNFRAHL